MFSLLFSLDWFVPLIWQREQNWNHMISWSDVGWKMIHLIHHLFIHYWYCGLLPMSWHNTIHSFFEDKCRGHQTLASLHTFGARTKSIKLFLFTISLVGFCQSTNWQHTSHTIFKEKGEDFHAMVSSSFNTSEIPEWSHSGDLFKKEITRSIDALDYSTNELLNKEWTVLLLPYTLKWMCFDCQLKETTFLISLLLKFTPQLISLAFMTHSSWDLASASSNDIIGYGAIDQSHIPPFCRTIQWWHLVFQKPFFDTMEWQSYDKEAITQ